MKELSKERVLKIFLVFVLLIGISFVQAGFIQTKNSAGVVKSNFSTSDEIYLKSTSGLCNGDVDSVNVYIVDSGNTELTDVRGEPQIINLTNYQIPPNTKIWAAPEAGTYDVIIDCDDSSTYNPGSDPITSFSVLFKKGSGNVSVETEISNHSWQYDPEGPVLQNEMLQLTLVAVGEDIDLANITIKSDGTGNDSQLDTLEVYLDQNNNSKVDEEDIIIGDSQPAYLQDNGETVIELDYSLTSGVAENILIVYGMKEDVAEGEYSLSVRSIYGIGAQSGEAIKFSGLPISSSVKKVLAEKTCVGSLVLEFSPNPVDQGKKAIAEFSNLTGCDNKNVILGKYPYAEVSSVGSCILKNNTCQLSIGSPENRTYYAFIDKNDDNDSLDIGESVSSSLVVNPKKTEKKNESVTGETTEVTNETTQETNVSAGVTGGVISELFSGSLKGVFILLEITLLLILIVLVIISFRIRSNRQDSSIQESRVGKKAN